MGYTKTEGRTPLQRLLNISASQHYDALNRYYGAVTRYAADVMFEQINQLEAAAKSVSDNPTDLRMAEGWVDGEYHVEAGHVPSGISVTVRTTVTHGYERDVQAEAFRRLRSVLNAVERYQLPWPTRSEERPDGQH